MILTRVETSPTVPTDVAIAYTVTASSIPFTSAAAAYTTCSNALTVNIASGAFAAVLKSQATINMAVYLAGSSISPRQADVRNYLSSAPSTAPTAAAIYSLGQPTPSPSVAPSTSQTEAPTAAPTYVVGRPTPVPSAAPSSPPTLAPTLLPAELYVAHVSAHLICRDGACFNSSVLF